MGFPAVIDYVLPGAAFGTCLFCRTAESKEYIVCDTEIWEGTVLICTGCARTLADLVGFVPHRRLAKAEKEASRLEAERDAVQGKADKYDRLLGDIRSNRKQSAKASTKKDLTKALA